MNFIESKQFPLFLLISFVLLASACSNLNSTAPAQPGESDHEVTHEEDSPGHDTDDKAMDHEDDDHAAGRVPNNGAVVEIISPKDGAEFKEGNDIMVEIETENFELDAEGKHWHIFVDDQSRGMIIGADYDEVVRGLEPGEHEISVFLSIGTHEELEDGATITVNIVE